MSKIAIVDDSRLARTFTASCLKKLAHTVQEIEPTSIFEVLKALKENTPDLMIMDFLMPDCPGNSLARVCHEDADLAGMKVIVLTAHRDDEVTARLKNMGVAEVLFKPVDAKELMAKVTVVLG